jgi:hypothetical protein
MRAVGFDNAPFYHQTGTVSTHLRGRQFEPRALAVSTMPSILAISLSLSNQGAEAGSWIVRHDEPHSGSVLIWINA